MKLYIIIIIIIYHCYVSSHTPRALAMRLMTAIQKTNAALRPDESPFLVCPGNLRLPWSEIWYIGERRGEEEEVALICARKVSELYM